MCVYCSTGATKGMGYKKGLFFSALSCSVPGESVYYNNVIEITGKLRSGKYLQD